MKSMEGIDRAGYRILPNMVFIFTGFSGEEYGYNDRWENGYFLYYGEGQEGDMEWSL